MKFKLTMLVFFGMVSGIFAQTCPCDSHLYYLKGERAYYLKQADSVEYYFKRAFENPDYAGGSSFYNTFRRLIRMEKVDYAIELLHSRLRGHLKMADVKDLIAEYPNLNVDISDWKDGDEWKDKKPDSLLVMELAFLMKRDQLIRTKYKGDYSDDFKKKIDYANFIALENILKRYGNKFPDLNTLGDEGEYNIKLLLTHFDIEWLARIFPMIVDAVQDGYMFGEAVLYQIERNIVDSGRVYLYDESSKKIKPGTVTTNIGSSPFYRQYYGGFDIYTEEGSFWWPFEKTADIDQVNKLRRALCLDNLKDSMERQPYNHEVSDDKFLRAIGYLKN